MNFSDIASKVAQLGAPLLASLIGGGVPAVATQAVKLVLDSLNVQAPAELDNALNFDPQAQIRIKEIETHQTIELNKLSNELAIAKFQEADSQRQHEANIQGLHQKDRESARHMHEAIADRTGQVESTPRNITYLFILGFFIALFTIPVLPLDNHDKDAFMLLVGMLAAKTNTIMDFWFGSSAEGVKHIYQLIADKFKKKPE